MTDLIELAIECQREKMKLEQQVKELTKWLDLKSEYIGKLETENKKLKEQLEKAIITLQALGITVTVDMEFDE